jgi:hypothetical protein
MQHAIRSLSRSTRAMVFVFAVVAATPLLFPSPAAAGPSTSPGVWTGTLSGQTFRLVVWNTLNEANATITFDSIGGSENLQYLGSKLGIDYFFRHADRAALSLYADGSVTYLSYFEKGSVRTIELIREE